MSYQLGRGGARVTLDILARKPTLAVEIDDSVHHVFEVESRGEDFEIRVDRRVFRGRRCVTAEEILIRLDGQSFALRRVSGLRDGEGAAGSGDEIRAEMPGTVVACHVAAGDAVVHGARLLTIESMKLQMTIAAPREGIVAQIHLGENVTFERGAVLISLVPLAAVPAGKEG